MLGVIIEEIAEGKFCLSKGDFFEGKIPEWIEYADKDLDRNPFSEEEVVNIIKKDGLIVVEDCKESQTDAELALIDRLKKDGMIVKEMWHYDR